MYICVYVYAPCWNFAVHFCGDNFAVIKFCVFFILVNLLQILAILVNFSVDPNGFAVIIAKT